MRITILAVGSRGDVQPYVALGVRLQQRGHQVRLGALEEFRASVAEAGLAFTPLGSLPPSARRTDGRTHGKGSERYGGLSGLVRFWLGASRIPAAPADAFLDASEGAELILYSRLAVLAPHVAEKLGVPCIAAFAAPSTPTREFAHPSFPSGIADSRAWIAATYQVDWLLSGHLIAGMVNRFRARAGLRPLSRRGLHSWHDERMAACLVPISESVLPRPRDWPVNVHMTGFWYADDEKDWCPPPELRRFLEAGPPPIVIGFGSMVPRDSVAMSSVITEALERTGCRAVLMSGWASLTGRAAHSERLLTIGSAPHSWLFPRSAAAIHHGGVGTCAAALRAGIPSVIVPFAFDQHFWGRRLHELGVAPAAVPITRLRGDRLAAAIETVMTDISMRAQAGQIARQIAAEDGIDRAIQIIERHLPRAGVVSDPDLPPVGRFSADAAPARSAR